MAEFVQRSSRQWDQAHAHGLIFPDDAEGIMLIEGAHLSVYNELDLRTLTRGSEKFEEVAAAMTKLDVPRHHVTGTTLQTEAVLLQQEEDEQPESDEEAILLELEEMDLGEEEAQEVLASLEQNKKRTWQKSQKLKRTMKKDRRFFDDAETEAMEGTSKEDPRGD